MRILFVEDNAFAAEYRSVLEFKGRYIVDWVNNLADAAGRLRRENGDPYGVIVLDLDLSRMYLRPDLRERAKVSGELAGWLFYMEVLSDEQRARTVFLSGFTQMLRSHVEERVFEQLSIIDKNDPEVFKKLEEMLGKLRVVDKNDADRDRLVKEHIEAIVKEAASVQ